MFTINYKLLGKTIVEPFVYTSKKAEFNYNVLLFRMGKFQEKPKEEKIQKDVGPLEDVADAVAKDIRKAKTKKDFVRLSIQFNKQAAQLQKLASRM